MSAVKTPTQIVIEKRLRQINAHSAWLGALSKLLGTVLVLSLIFSFIFGVAAVDDMDMAPAVKEGDIVLYDRLQNEYAVGDAIIYQAEGDLHVGRIVAQFTDTVEITVQGELIINGHVQKDEANVLTMPAEGGLVYPVVLGADSYFVLGDNRSSSHDSREFGVISQEDVMGKVFTLMRRRAI